MSQANQKSLLETLDECPPFVVYYASHLALGRRLTLGEFVKSSGLPCRTFSRTARQISWARVKVSVMDRFCRACGINPLHPETVFDSLAAELNSPKPFDGMGGHCRKKMLKHFNLLSSRAAMLAKERPVKSV